MMRLLLDALLFVLFVAEMCFYHLPKDLHEIFGVAFVALTILHVAINRRRFASLFKKVTARKFFCLTTDVALTICALIILATGVCMSNFLFVDTVSFEVRRNMTLHQLHVALPYVAMILVGLHVGFHRSELWQRFLNACGLTELFQRRRKLFATATVVLSIVGAYGLYLNRVVDRIMMKHIFGTPATDLPAAVFALMIVGGIALFASITAGSNRK